MRRVLSVVFLVFAAVSVTACGTTSTAAPQGATVVDISRMAFRPRVVHVVVGQVVAWRFDDAGVLHNVTSDDGTTLHSPNQDRGIWVHTFTATGVVHYYCTIHPYMTGEVIVDP